MEGHHCVVDTNGSMSARDQIAHIPSCTASKVQDASIERHAPQEFALQNSKIGITGRSFICLRSRLIECVSALIASMRSRHSQVPQKMYHDRAEGHPPRFDVSAVPSSLRVTNTLIRTHTSK